MVAIEPHPGNCGLLRQNVMVNGVATACTCSSSRCPIATAACHLRSRLRTAVITGCGSTAPGRTAPGGAARRQAPAGTARRERLARTAPLGRPGAPRFGARRALRYARRNRRDRSRPPRAHVDGRAGPRGAHPARRPFTPRSGRPDHDRVWPSDFGARAGSSGYMRSSPSTTRMSLTSVRRTVRACSPPAICLHSRQPTGGARWPTRCRRHRSDPVPRGPVIALRSRRAMGPDADLSSEPTQTHENLVYPAARLVARSPVDAKTNAKGHECRRTSLLQVAVASSAGTSYASCSRRAMPTGGRSAPARAIAPGCHDAENVVLDLRMADACDEALAGSARCTTSPPTWAGWGSSRRTRRAACCPCSSTPTCCVRGQARSRPLFLLLLGLRLRRREAADAEHHAAVESDAYPAEPEDGYGWEKLFSERMCRHFREDFGLTTRAARYHNVYGPHGTWTGGREKAPAAICRKVAEASSSVATRSRSGAMASRPAASSTSMTASMARGRSWTAHQAPINLGSSEMVSINELVDIVEAIAGITVARRYDLDAPKGVQDATVTTR